MSRFFLLLLLFYSLSALPQDTTTTDLRIEAFGSVSNGANTPFWIVSNNFGIVPLQANSSYLRATVAHNIFQKNDLRLDAVADLVAVTPRYRKIYAQQLYAELSYHFLNLRVGSKENYTSLWDRELSSGDLVASSNYLPIPEINISVPQFTVIPYTAGWLQVRGNFGVGRSMDSEYLKRQAGPKQHYVKNVLWQRKALHLRVLDTKSDLPFSAIIGIQHHAQWGGESTNPDIGALPQSFDDFVRIFLGKSGSATATIGDRINVLGNHYGSYDVKLAWLSSLFDLYIYKQHFFDDVSGMELYNFTDGLYGIQANIKQFQWIDKVLIEFLDTRNQSGPLHLIEYDHDAYPGYGGGCDNYYNNGDYSEGVSYFSRSVGSPLLTSPEYNKNGVLSFMNNRVKAYHTGMNGRVSKQLAWKFLLTVSYNYGTHGRPFLDVKKAYSYALKLLYCHPSLNGWLFTTQFGSDNNSITRNTMGFCLSAAKTIFE